MPSPPSPADLNARGIDLYVRGDRTAALACFEAALRADPGFVQALNNRALARRAGGDLPGALEDLDAALSARPGYAEALNNRALARQEAGDLAGALADLDAALEWTPRNSAAPLYHNRGVVWHQRGDLARALEDFDAALVIDPGHTRTHGKRALARRDRGDLRGALADLDTALAHTPAGGSAGLLHARGGVRILLGDVAGAIADYDAVLRIDPLCCVVYVSRGNARYHRRDPEAWRDYLTAFRLDAQRAAGEVVRLLAHDARQDAEGVLENCSRHARLNPADPVAPTREGLTLLLLGRDAQARSCFEQAVRLLPAGRGVLGLLVEAVQQERQSRRAS